MGGMLLVWVGVVSRLRLVIRRVEVRVVFFKRYFFDVGWLVDLVGVGVDCGDEVG